MNSLWRLREKSLQPEQLSQHAGVAVRSATLSARRRAVAFTIFAFFALGLYSWAQDSPSTATQGETASAVRDLQDQVHQLRELVEQMRTENAESRSEMKQLRQDLQATRALLQPRSDGASTVAPSVARSISSEDVASPDQGSTQPTSLEAKVEKLEESTSLMDSKIDEQHQTKVETVSKYRARLHGIVLINAFRNVGESDNLDFPSYAQPTVPGTPQATFGATLRQSEIGLELLGPRLAGAATSADIQFDFAGGFPSAPNGVNFGIVRLRNASVRFDWEHTSVIAGQDPLFISPLSPTSFASLAIPAFSTAGNLWAWTPQLRVEHRFTISDEQTLTVQAGILDNLDWESNYDSFNRTPQAGELSGQPAYALRTEWSHPIHQRPLAVGVAGYYGRQDWTSDHYVDAWAGMADWRFPIISRLALSGEFYRGRGIGGLGGGIGRSVVYGGNPAYSYYVIRGLDAAGGWTQLKFQLTPKLEFNGALAEDDAFASDIRGFASDQNNFGPIFGRNRGALANVVFRPRSDLVLAGELRRLRTFPVYSSSSVTNQVNLSVGMLF